MSTHAAPRRADHTQTGSTGAGTESATTFALFAAVLMLLGAAWGGGGGVGGGFG
jgi:hypothetical protein